ncbi:MFS transporter [Lactobacillus panisapium]|uniref:MFS transporter n=1 Tax=Lactobacillus panisapium TaxID=2012495 RepID=UPI001C6A0472|nr:MFS transporter [Lactobacillus panisapium]QYN57294.1 MFS transporter [Lactobacillus panisapium]
MENGKIPHAGSRLDRLPTSKFHWKIFLIVGFALLTCWSNAIGGLVLAQLKTIGWTNNNLTALFTSLSTAGMFFGALLGGYVGDRSGRKKTFLFFEVMHILTMIIAAASPNMSFLMFDRFFMGIALGALLTILFASFTEYMPSRSRGTWSSRVSFIGNWSYPVCSVIAMFLTETVAPDMNWRLQFIIPAVLSSLISCVAWKVFPESPRWLESKGRYNEATKVLTSIENEVIKETHSNLPSAKKENVNIKKNISYSELFKGDLLKRVVLGSFSLIAMNVTQYTLINWLPTMFLTQGINIKNSVFLNTMNMFGAPVGIFIATLIMDKIPRKAMGIGLLSIMAILGYIYSLQKGMLMISILGFFLMISVYMFVCYASAVYVPEIWPTNAKLRGSGICNAIGRISGIIVPFVVAKLLDTVGVTGVFILLGVTCLITALMIGIFGIETRGKSVEEIGSI